MIPGRPALRAGGQYRGRATGPMGEWKEALLPATSHRASQALPGNLGLQSDPTLAHRHCHRPQGQAAWGEARGGRQPVAASGSSENRTDHIGQRAATRLTPRQRPHRAPEKDEPRTAGTQTPCLLGRQDVPVCMHVCACARVCLPERRRKAKRSHRTPPRHPQLPGTWRPRGQQQMAWLYCPVSLGRSPGAEGCWAGRGPEPPYATAHRACQRGEGLDWLASGVRALSCGWTKVPA